MVTMAISDKINLLWEIDAMRGALSDVGYQLFGEPVPNEHDLDRFVYDGDDAMLREVCDIINEGIDA